MLKYLWIRIKIFFGFKIMTFDFDGVGWNLDKIMSQLVYIDYGIEYKTQDATYWAYFYEKYPKSTRCWTEWDLYKQAGFIEGFLEFFEEVKAIYGPDAIQFVTSSPESIQEEKTKMMTDILGVDVIHVTKENKSKYTKGTILIDDAAHNIEDHLENTSNKAILFDLHGTYGWSKHFNVCNIRSFRTHNYKELLTCLKTQI